MRTPTFAQLRKFCEEDGWDPKARTDHWRFTKKMPDESLSLTKISFGAGQIGDPKLFAVIARDQLRVSIDEFWRVVDHGGPAVRPSPALPEVPLELPAWLTYQLLKEGATPAQLQLGEDDAKRLLDQLRSRPRP